MLATKKFVLVKSNNCLKTNPTSKTLTIHSEKKITHEFLSGEYCTVPATKNFVLTKSHNRLKMNPTAKTARTHPEKNITGELSDGEYCSCLLICIKKAVIMFKFVIL